MDPARIRHIRTTSDPLRGAVSADQVEQQQHHQPAANSAPQPPEHQQPQQQQGRRRSEDGGVSPSATCSYGERGQTHSRSDLSVGDTPIPLGARSNSLPVLYTRQAWLRASLYHRRPRSVTSTSDVIMEEQPVHEAGESISPPSPGVDADKAAPSSPRDPRLSGETNHSSNQNARLGPPGSDLESKRLSFSSLFSIGSAVHTGTASAPNPASGESSVAGSMKGAPTEPSLQSTSTATVSPSASLTKLDTSSASETSVAGKAIHHGHNGLKSNHPSAAHAQRYPESWDSGSLPRLQNPAPDRRSRSRTQRRPSSTHMAGSLSPSTKDRKNTSSSSSSTIPKLKIGVCALDTKARSKPSRNILTRLQNNDEFEIIVFGDKVILDEAVENWPLCDFLISFFSDGFPLDKAIAYVNLRRPFCVNDLAMQKVLWDRRLCLRILDRLGVRTPKRLEVNRDGGPTLDSAALADHVHRLSGMRLDGPESGVGGDLSAPQSIELSEDTNTLSVDGFSLSKPFVEKPVSGEDHNVRIYFPKTEEGGGGRKLFRKIGNKSSEWDNDLIVPRAITEPNSSYLYEQFLDVENAEDVKAYTVGSNFCHAETRKSPVVDGLVRRNRHGKEIRYITSLSAEEQSMASRIADGFGQRICGFDLLRANGKSYVIDVNGWSFVKDNNEYYDKSAAILRQMFDEHLRQKAKREFGKVTPQVPQDPSQESDAEPSHQRQQGSHRAVLKDLLRSPSLHRLRPRANSKSQSGAISPVEISAATTPITSPPASESGWTEPLVPPPVSASDTQIHAHTAAGTSPLGQAAGVHDPSTDAPMPAAKHSWKLKGMVSVIRHGDRTPKQKFKFTFHTQPFVDLLKGHQEEVLLKGEAALSSVMNAVRQAMKEGIEDPEKLSLLKTSLARKGAWTGTKVQIKPMFKKRIVESPLRQEFAVPSQPQTPKEDEDPRLRTTRSDSLGGGVTLSRFSAQENDLIFDKLQLIIKWGGEPTHSARYQSHDLGENMRNDYLLMNREVLGDVRVFTSSERRVSTSAQIWAASFLEQKDVPESFITVRKDLLDDSNAAKDIMDKVKKKLKLLLREGVDPPPQFAWPANTPRPAAVVRRVVELMKFHRRVMRYNFNKLKNGSLSNSDQSSGKLTQSASSRSLSQPNAVASIQSRWCSGEDADLFKERWEKLFAEFTDAEKVDPSKISELYDTMKFDALHNRQFLEWTFTPTQGFLDEYFATEKNPIITKKEKVLEKTDEKSEGQRTPTERMSRKNSGVQASQPEKGIAHRMSFRRRSISGATSPLPIPENEESQSYFKLFSAGGGQSRAKQDARLESLRELYRYAKILFDFICPQEYGISDSEKLEIGLLTSLPLLREITSDLEEVQASEDAKAFVYFTKESHIYTLLNSILEGGVKTKIARNAIPELDYLSQICFELYEAVDKEADTFAYSIRITISPGCHTSDPLDLQLDSKHSIGCAPRRSLTAHQNWKEVIETLRDKFHTVKLPKSFLMVNLSEKHAREMENRRGEDTEGLERDPVNILGQEHDIAKEVEDGPDAEMSMADLEAESEVVRKVQKAEVDESNY